MAMRAVQKNLPILITLLVMSSLLTPHIQSIGGATTYKVVERLNVEADAVKVPVILDMGDGWALVLVLARDYGPEPDTLYALLINVTEEGVRTLDERSFSMDGFATNTRVFRASDVEAVSGTPYAAVAVLYKMTYPVDLYPFIEVVSVPVSNNYLIQDPNLLVNISLDRRVRVLESYSPCPGHPLLYLSVALLNNGKSMSLEEDWNATPALIGINLSNGEYWVLEAPVSIRHSASNNSFTISSRGASVRGVDRAGMAVSPVTDQACNISSGVFWIYYTRGSETVVNALAVDPPGSIRLNMTSSVPGKILAFAQPPTGLFPAYMAISDDKSNRIIIYRVSPPAEGGGVEEVMGVPLTPESWIGMYWMGSEPFALYLNGSGTYFLDLSIGIVEQVAGDVSKGGVRADTFDGYSFITVSHAWDLYLISPSLSGPVTTTTTTTTTTSSPTTTTSETATTTTSAQQTTTAPIPLKEGDKLTYRLKVSGSGPLGTVQGEGSVEYSVSIGQDSVSLSVTGRDISQDIATMLALGSAVSDLFLTAASGSGTTYKYPSLTGIVHTQCPIFNPGTEGVVEKSTQILNYDVSYTCTYSKGVLRSIRATINGQVGGQSFTANLEGYLQSTTIEGVEVGGGTGLGNMLMIIAIVAAIAVAAVAGIVIARRK